MHPISAFIITKNEEARITKSIISLQNLADEILVIDSGSTDKTVEIAKKLRAKVYHNDWPGYAAQKAFGESKCKHNWILNIDADEEISSSLRDEIDSIFTKVEQDRFKAYRLKIVIMHRTDTKPRFLAPRNKPIRFYRKDFASFKNSLKFTTRDAVTLNDGEVEKGNVSILKHPTHHYSGTSIEQLVAKANFYSSQQAKDLVANGRIPSKARIYTEFFFHFFRAFIIRRYFVFGYHGFVDSVIFAFARFLRLAKAREEPEDSN